ncbi:MAG: glutathione S-transferase N-terminal domain-containing protein [Alphaproteobacteria bacterium]|nr:glutathione S-transferase N-terminal domain-containing protein [Alphaproteobacteria bacterium]MBV8410540.1 glutathione S-transferase N-terminal domain-containing protein [Alphaproteobacteria bacterium]
MAEEIVFYHNPRSRAQMVHWMLEEAGAPYRIVPIDLEKGEHKTPSFLALNPMGKLPTIEHRGMVVTETAAIIAYIADAFPAAALAPTPGDALRGPYYRWLFFGAGVIEPALIDKMMNRPEVERKSALGWGSYEDVVGTLEKALSNGPYLLGDKFSAADVYVGSELRWAMMFGAPGLKGQSVFDDYVARLSARPAAQRASPA